VFFPLPLFQQVHDNGPFEIKTNFTHTWFTICKDNIKLRKVWWVTILSLVNDVLSLVNDAQHVQ
jgi:hypothetical protein